MHKNLPIITFILFVLVVPVFAGQTDTGISLGTYCDGAVRFSNTDSVHTDIYTTICQNELPYHYVNGQIDTTFEVDTPPLSTLNFQFSTITGCDSVVTLHLFIVPSPEMHAIMGDTNVCRNQYVEFFYPNDFPEGYSYLWYLVRETDTPMGTNVPSLVWYTGDSGPQEDVTIGMRVKNLQYNCIYDTTIVVHVCDKSSPNRTQIVRKNNSNMLICDNTDFPDNIHYRWGYTDKFTFDENAYDWDYTYYQFSSIDTSHFRYWVETYVINGDVTCRNRTYYLDDIVTGVGQLEPLDVIAYMYGNQLQIQVDNPSEQHTVASLYDLSGRTIAQWDFGTASTIKKQIPFGYSNGIYLLTVQVGKRHHTTKILSQQ